MVGDLPATDRRHPADDLLRTGTVIVTDPGRAGGARKGASVGSLSLLIHSLILGAAILFPLLARETLPEPAQGLKAFLVAPPDVALPPPPPPPAPPAAPHAARPQMASAPTNVEFVAPIEVPDEIAPEEGLDLGVEGGVAGGVEGGVPGGVVGGVVGGLPVVAPPVAPVRVGGDIREPRKLRHVPPVYPDMALSARVQGVVILECTISPQGRVQNVKVLRSIPLLDDAAIEAVQQWVYSPTLVGGVPVPVVMTVTVRFNLA
jgi:protein TonB